MPFIGQPRRVSYASDPWNSRGRHLSESMSPTRTEFQRDRDRILHSTAFRRLKLKTQVFIAHEGDHHRTRLTHSLEVAQIARAISRALGLDEDLSEALALSHDLGHPPFGHSGERALDEWLQPYGGFDHNAQALKVVTRLERRYAAFDGLNLTWETLEGLVKHNGPLISAEGKPAYVSHKSLPLALQQVSREQDLWLETYASAEAQAAAISDDIAYNSHDIDDGLRAGFFTVDELAEVPLLAQLLSEVRRQWPHLDAPRTGYELVRRVITVFIEDVITTSESTLRELSPGCADDIRFLPKAVIGFSPNMAILEKQVKQFLYVRLWRHERVTKVMDRAEQVVKFLCEHYQQSPHELPMNWQPSSEWDKSRLSHHISDYIAGMTDWFAVQEYQRLSGKTIKLDEGA